MLIRTLKARSEERYQHVLVTLMGGELLTPIQAAGVDVVSLANRSKLGRVIALAGLVRRLRPALIHARLSSAGLWSRLATALAGYRGPFLQAHGGETYRGHGLKRRLMERFRAGAISRHVCVSRSVADHLLAHGHRRDDLVIIPNGITMAGIEGRDARPMADPPRFVCVGRLSEEKGQDVLVAAMAHLRDSGIAVRLDLVGDGPLRPQVEALISDHGLGGQIGLLGMRNDVGRLLATYDGFILPSLTEGLSLALLEGMAAGLPVVATAVGETPLVVGDDGWLVPPRDPAALADALAAVVGAPDAALAKAADGQARVRQTFTMDAMADRYLNLIDGTLEAAT
ncbi:Glycosyltransferase involved in cell wall bisynthesis [Rhodospira trueperi]|uniref:Glycosyltransferase involved in cell wall bisynthesis n=2 Tax=Rhodospira trueperi TaxID=69960 RepID=A0A1G7BZL1_9PROT|nr:Glycosyltransferase involved in cell wall bisynthesis [Rhodospira trueperi]